MYKIGNTVTALVTGITSYGFFVKLEDDSTGLVHISEISDRFVDDINKYVEIGEIIRVEVLGINEKNHYNLSIKNIDYRIMNNKGSKIKETPQGFKNLALSLDKWIEEGQEKIKN